MENKQNKGIDIIENAESLKKEVFKLETFFEKNKKIVSAFGIGLLAGIAAYFGYKYYSDSQEKEAQAAMYDAVYSFEADSLNKALKGQGGNAGLLSIADDYGSTKAGQLASLYAGVAYMNQGKYAEAIEKFENFDAGDQVLQAKAYALIGDCQMETKKTQDAISSYKKAASYKPNKLATPGYMMKLALAQTESGSKKDAIDTYTEISEKYPTSTESYQAKKYKSRLEAEIGQ